MLSQFGPLAHQVEQQPFKLWVLGSSPRRPISHSRWRMRNDPEPNRYQESSARDHPMRPMNWYVYIAECGDHSLYTGITTDAVQRLQRHNAGQGSKYVRSKGDARLVHVETHATKSLAQRRELEIKSWSRKEKLALIERASLIDV